MKRVNCKLVGKRTAIPDAVNCTKHKACVSHRVCVKCTSRVPAQPGNSDVFIQVRVSPRRAQPMRPPSEWSQRGASYWAKLHRWAHFGDLKNLTPWLEAFHAQMPRNCDCRKKWVRHLEQFPPPTGSHAELLAWTIDLHNRVNHGLGKPMMPIDQTMALWGDATPRRAMVIGNWFGDKIRPNSRASFKAAAERWGVAYHESTAALSGTRNGFTEKLLIDLHAAAFDQVLYLDRDMVIRSDCPSPFELVPLDSFAAVPSCQPGHDWRHQANEHLLPIFKRQGMAFDPAVDHFNGGLYVFSPALHGWIFGTARELATKERDRHWSVYEEGLVSLATIKSGVPIVRLDKTYNRCGGPSRETWQPKMEAHLQHYCGDHNRRDARMDQTIWDLRPADRPDRQAQILSAASGHPVAVV